MVLSIHPTHPTGKGPVKAKILADTVCQPHGQVQAGDVVEVTTDEYFALKHAGKAELHREEETEKQPAPPVATPGSEASDKVTLTKTITLDELNEALDKKTKAELISIAKSEFGLELSESLTKRELTDAIVDAALKGKV